MSKNNEDFAKNLAKGRIAETIFWMMLRDDERFFLLPFGYEHLLPELTRFKNKLDTASTKSRNKISQAPDFILLTRDRKKIYLVEVKYRWDQSNLDRVRSYAKKTLEQWEDCYYFIATPTRFFFDTCKNIANINKPLENKLDMFIKPDIQQKYLDVLQDLVQLRTKKEKNGSYTLQTHCIHCTAIMDFGPLDFTCMCCGKEMMNMDPIS